MFIDTVKMQFLAGNGGNGVVAWRREKFIPKGGPAGGDGGKGGSIFIEAEENLFSLDHLRNCKIYKASSGANGSSNNKQGKDAQDLLLKVPNGTLVKDLSGNILWDFTKTKKPWKICQGGRGGRGNVHFKSPTNQAPLEHTLGTEGEIKEVVLELKLLADVGLVGMPNAGKSTLISKISHVKVKIAPYPFTTLRPNLGIVEFTDFSRILVADIPGIIEEAHNNKGLGLSFLKHIERTSLLLYVIDASGVEGREPFEDFLLLQNEMRQYNPDLLKKPFLVALNKSDQPAAKQKIKEFKKAYPYPKNTLFTISALENENLSPLLEDIKVHCQKEGKKF